MSSWGEEEEEEQWDGGGDSGGGGGVLKPRKAKNATLAYLATVNKAWEPEADAARQQAQNIARELRWEAASVAADKVGSEILEAVVRRCSLQWVEKIARWCAPYAVFLSKHRHSSHVLQTLLSLLVLKNKEAVVEEEEEEEEEDEEAEEEDEEDRAWAALSEVAGAGRIGVLLWRALEPQFEEVIVDGCASHVLRAVVCSLAQLPVIAERRGRRNERHTHSVDDALKVEDDATMSARARGRPELLRTTLNELCTALCALKGAKLHALAVDISGAPFLALTLRVLALTDRADNWEGTVATMNNEGSVGSRLIGLLFELEWDAEWSTWNCEDDDRSSAILFGLSSDRSGSVLAEAALRHCSDQSHTRLSELILRTSGKKVSLSSFVQGSTSNYVVQSLLRSLRNEESASKVAAAMIALLTRITQPDRLGVLSALTTVMSTFSTIEQQKAMVNAFMKEDNLFERLAWDADSKRTREHGVRALTSVLGFQELDVAAFTAGVFDKKMDLLNQVLKNPVPWCKSLTTALCAKAPQTAVQAALFAPAAELPNMFVASAVFNGGDAKTKELILSKLAPMSVALEAKAPAFVARSKFRLFISNPKLWRQHHTTSRQQPTKKELLPHKKEKKRLDDIKTMADHLEKEVKKKKKKKPKTDSEGDSAPPKKKKKKPPSAD